MTSEEIDAYYQEKLALLDTLELNRYERMMYGSLLFDMWRTKIESIGNAKITGLDKPTDDRVRPRRRSAGARGR